MENERQIQAKIITDTPLERHEWRARQSDQEILASVRYSLASTTQSLRVVSYMIHISALVTRFHL